MNSGKPPADPAAAAETIAKLLWLIRAGEIAASGGAINRLEGAYIALRVTADGEIPQPEDLDAYMKRTFSI